MTSLTTNAARGAQIDVRFPVNEPETVAGLIGQPSEVTIRFRLKGIAGAADYSSSVKPPHHALMSAQSHQSEHHNVPFPQSA